MLACKVYNESMLGKVKWRGFFCVMIRIERNDLPEVLRYKEGNTEMNSPAQKRYVVYWNAVLVTENGGNKIAHQGHAHDISLTGVTIFAEEAIKPKTPVLLTLRIPQGKSVKEWATVEIKCSTGIVAAEEDHFRIELHFKEFMGNGRQILEEVLKTKNAMSESEDVI